MGLFKEFKEFAVKGNVFDMAVGIIIGGAFGPIVSSMVNDLIMPPIGLVLGKMDFSSLKLVIQEAAAEVKDASGAVVTPAVAEVAVKYGAFINTLINFVIVAWCVFMLVKIVNRMKRQAEAPAPAGPPKPTKEQELLGEIRDLLAARR